jgi:hypothetical protein
MSTSQSPGQTTKLNRPWLAKMIIFCVVLVFFGFYGLYDALIAYPDRGMRFATFCQFQYLDTAKTNGILDRRLSVADPAAEYARLRTQDRGRMTGVETARLEWLKALSVVGKLQPAQTTIDDPDKKYADLKAQWTTAAGGGKKAPKPLAAFDIPVQWVFVAIGLGGGAWLILLFLNVARQRYSFDSATQTLTLPDGNTLAPSDIEEFDKRKWDKFLVFAKVKPSHATLGGREIKLDLYRYTPLETWVLDMEKTAFPESQTPSEPAPSSGAPVG